MSQEMSETTIGRDEAKLLKQYPISETFHSLQGEGVWMMHQMFFVRMAGCNVGEYRRFDPDAVVQEPVNKARIQNPKHSICASVLGNEFLCDTDYHQYQKMAAKDILEQCGDRRMCITGGEPFVHELFPLCYLAAKAEIPVHVETSGTMEIPVWVNHLGVWVTCSPKRGFKPENYPFISEWKFVVGAELGTPEEVGDKIKGFLEKVQGNVQIKRYDRVYIQPSNDIHEIDSYQLDFAMEVLQQHKHWALSPQLHKFLRLR